MAPELMCHSAFLALPLTDSELSGGLHRYWLREETSSVNVAFEELLPAMVHASEEVVAFAAFAWSAVYGIGKIDRSSATLVAHAF